MRFHPHGVRPMTPSASTRSDVESLRWNETLDNGTRLLIRAIRKDDVELERDFIERMSPEARRIASSATSTHPARSC